MNQTSTSLEIVGEKKRERERPRMMVKKSKRRDLIAPSAPEVFTST